MPLKPFWIKKYHLGIKSEDVKTILNEARNNIVADITNELITVSLADVYTLVGGDNVTYQGIPEAKFANWVDILENPNKTPRSIAAKVATGADTYSLLVIPFIGTNAYNDAAYMTIVDIASSPYVLYVILEGYNANDKTYTFKASILTL